MKLSNLIKYSNSSTHTQFYANDRTEILTKNKHKKQTHASEIYSRIPSVCLIDLNFHQNVTEKTAQLPLTGDDSLWLILKLVPQ